MSVDLERFGAIPLFQGLKPADLQAVLDASRPRRVAEEAYFFYQGDSAGHLYVLTEGTIKLGQVTPDGQQVILHMIGPWEIFGLIAFVENGIYPASAEATAACLALSWDRDSLVQLTERCPRLALNAMQLMAGRVHDFQDRIRELSTERVERRLARVMLRLVRQVGKKVEGGVLVDLAISRQELAEMSGTTLYTVSRILAQWERQGIIDAGRERVVIRFPHGLVRIAEDLAKSDG